MTTVNEGSTAYLTANFKDKDSVLAAPTTISYRIDCLTNGSEVKDDTAFTPAASSIEIELTKTDNALINQANYAERRLVTVTGTYGDDDEIIQEYEYDLINMKKKPSP